MNHGAHEQLPSSSATPQVGEALEDAAAGEARGDELDAERLAEAVPQHHLGEHLEAEVGREVGLAAAVERDRHVEALDLGPERVVRGVVPRPAVHASRARGRSP